MPKLFTFLLLSSLFLGMHCQSALPEANPSVDCLVPGTWGNDFIPCGRIRITAANRGDLQQRLKEELKLTVRANGTGEFSFYDCQTQQRIPNPIHFAFSVVNGQLKLTWTGSADEIRTSTTSFNYKNEFAFTCKQDTIFIDPALMQNTMYNGATYFVRR